MWYQALHELIIERMKGGWALEQLFGRLTFETALNRVCQETIYRFVHSKKDMQEDLWRYLFEHRRKRPLTQRPRAPRR